MYKITKCFTVVWLAVITVLFVIGLLLHEQFPKRNPTFRIDSNPKRLASPLSNSYSMMLAIRMSAKSKLVYHFYCSMLRSAVLFWSPKLSNLTLILDEESKTDHKFAAELQKQKHLLGFSVNFMYERLPKDMTCLKAKRGRFTVGYNRQLWSSFFMDLYTDADIIGWSDTDAVFSTPVTLENIFKGSKLRVIGVGITNRYQGTWDQATRVALGKKMLASFMVNFPTFIWRDTFTNCRKYILKHLNVSSFEDAFKQFHKPPAQVSSTVSLVMTYAYYFEHDRYDWHLDVHNNLTRFNIEHVEAGFKVPPAETSPDLHVTVHQKYYHETIRRNALKQGYCVAKRAVDKKLPNGCSEFHNITNFQLFEFEVTKRWHTHHLDTWCGATEGKKRCTELIEKHYQNVARYYRNGWYDLDLHKVFAIEKAAATVGHLCPRIFDDKV